LWLFAKGIFGDGGIKPKTHDGEALAAAAAVDFVDRVMAVDNTPPRR